MSRERTGVDVGLPQIFQFGSVFLIHRRWPRSTAPPEPNVPHSQRPERRRTHRFIKVRPATLAARNGLFCGHTCDLSLTGAALWLTGAPRMSGWVRLSVQREGEPLIVHGVVRRVRPTAEDGYDVGVEFVDLRPHDRFALAELISERRRSTPAPLTGTARVR